MRLYLYLSQTVPDSDWPTKMMTLLREAIHLKHISPQGRTPDNEVGRIRRELDELMCHCPLVEDETQQKTIKDFFLNLQAKKRISADIPDKSRSAAR